MVSFASETCSSALDPGGNMNCYLMAEKFFCSELYSYWVQIQEEIVIAFVRPVLFMPGSLKQLHFTGSEHCLEVPFLDYVDMFDHL